MIKKCVIILLSIIVFCSCSNDDKTTMGDIGYDDTSKSVMSLSDLSVLSKEVNGELVDIPEHTCFVGSDLLRLVFRIPSVVITNKGTVLVSCENREIFADKGEIDILVSRKCGNENTWEIRNVMAQDSAYGRSMNPVLIVDRNGSQGKKGRIYLFACHLLGEGVAATTTTEEADIVYKYSDDDGKTWSSEYSLKHLWDTSGYTAVIPSAANGIQLDDGTFLLPTMVVKDAKWRSGLAIKRPNGSWRFSKPTPNVNDNECTVYEDNDGAVILDCRTKEKVRRRYKYDSNTDEFTLLEDQPKVKVNLKAEIHKIDYEGAPLYLMVYVDTSTNKRENITLYSSSDACNWDKVYRVQEGVVAGAYAKCGKLREMHFFDL